MPREQIIIQEVLPKDFPMPTCFTEKQQGERESKKVESPYDEHHFYFKDGQIDKEWITNMWYVLYGKTGNIDYAKPEEIQIKYFAEFLIDHIGFEKYFSQSSAFKEMMNRPDDDFKRWEVINFISDLIIKTFGNDLRTKITKIPGLSEKINNFIKNEIKNAAFFIRESNKWSKTIDSNEKEPEEFEKFRSMINNNKKLKDQIGEILTKEKLWE